ncbi:MAG: tyrosine-protein phosphatase [Thermoleophilia bacterium]
MKFIDTHCHILPGVDDGPADLARSLAMARVAAEDGIDTIVATPHVIEGLYDRQKWDTRRAQLTEALATDGIGISLFSGAEVPMSVCLSETADSLGKITLAGSRYLLMETADTTYEQLSRAVHQVRLNGYFPILAHPERVGFIQERPSSLTGITAQGNVYCQLTAASIEGLFGKSMHRCAVALLKLGLVHLVASDGHSAVKRPPLLSDCHRLLREMLGRQAAGIIMLDNPRKVLQNQPLEIVAPKQKRRGWFISRIVRGGRA